MSTTTFTPLDCERKATIDALAGNRTLTATIATEQAVLVFDARSGSAIAEVLLLGGAVIPRQVPLLVDHARSLTAVVGSVSDLRVESTGLVGSLRFAAGSEMAEHAWSVASGRHSRAVSVGYRIFEAEEIPPGRTAVVAGREFRAPPTRPLRVVTRWEIKEVSLVAIGADPSAMIRSATQGGDMPTILDTIRPSSAQDMRVDDLLAVVLRSRGEHVPYDPLEVIRSGLSTVDGVEAVTGIVNTAILSGFRGGRDTTAGWLRTISLPNYFPGKLAFVDQAIRLGAIGRGGTAATVGFAVSEPGRWGLVRFGCQFELEEQDLVDYRDIGIMQIALAEVGAAARRLIPDMVYATLLSNPELPDGTPLFHASRGNLATGGGSSFGSTSLATAHAAIGAQLLADEEDDPVHVGLEGAILIVPPDDVLAGRKAVREITLGDGADLIVRGESRLGTAGVVNPLNDQEIIAGNGKNWLLAAPADLAASVVLGLLKGRREPTIRTGKLGGGRWGIWVDVQFSCGVAAVDGRPLHWSTGE